MRDAPKLLQRSKVQMQTKHVFSVLGACAVIAFAAAACDDGHHGFRGGLDRENLDACNQFTTCDTCTPQNGCGWCFDGTNSFCGSDANQCSSEWTWETNFCRDSADASVSTGTAPGPSDDASTGTSTDASDDGSSDAASTD
jgi:hypothetical protein